MLCYIMLYYITLYIDRITDWKGRFGWIQPDEPIGHPQAAKRGGRVYLAQDDVDEVISGVGAQVSFFVYSDHSGLGAMRCVPADSASLYQDWLGLGAEPCSAAGGGLEASTQLATAVAEPLALDLAASLLKAKPKAAPANLPQAEARPKAPMEPGKVASTLPPGPLQSPPPAPARSPEAASEEAAPTAAPVVPVAVLKATPKLAPFGSAGLRAGDPLVARPAPKSDPAMRPAPKASSPAACLAADPELFKRMAENPVLARRLLAWMSDPGG